MSFLRRFFSGAPGNAEPNVVAEEEYQGHRIEAAPMKEGDQWRLCAHVSKPFGNEVMVHEVIRADLFQSAEDAARHSLSKARQVIDESGDHIYKRDAAARADAPGEGQEAPGSQRGAV